MAAGTSRKISAASARAHTRKSKQNTSFIPSGVWKKILLVFFVGFLAWAYQATRPPPPTIGVAVTGSRIKLKDGRHLAYEEYGVPKDKAKHKFVYLHGFDNSRHDAALRGTLSEDTVESLGIYIVSFDRPGYGESDPNPNRTPKNMASDVEELADQLELGSKFYVVGFSMGGEAVYTCLKYIPHRLAGAALLAPIVNYWWPGLPTNLSSEAYSQQLPQDQWALRVAHYMPWLAYWGNTLKLFPALSILSLGPESLCPQDKDLLPRLVSSKENYKDGIRQQGEFESLHRDLIVGFGNWEFDPTDLESHKEGLVHLWMGDEDTIAPVKLQRYLAQHLPWICYHELQGAGHFFPYADGMGDSVLKALLSGRCDAPHKA